MQEIKGKEKGEKVLVRPNRRATLGILGRKPRTRKSKISSSFFGGYPER